VEFIILRCDTQGATSTGAISTDGGSTDRGSASDGGNGGDGGSASDGSSASDGDSGSTSEGGLSVSGDSSSLPAYMHDNKMQVVIEVKQRVDLAKDRKQLLAQLDAVDSGVE
jgi:hypothetical protein